MQRFDAEVGDVILMIADPAYATVVSALGRLRLHLAQRLGLVPHGKFCPVWVTDFPLFEPTDDGVTSSHHPFTSPNRLDFDPTDRDGLLKLSSRAYDLVVNGEELGGGSIRINDKDVQLKVFRALGLTDAEIEEKFGFFIRALDYGAPPHGGLALGLDRVVSMILNTPSIREVTAFPKNRSAFCPLTEAPTRVAEEQLRELGLLDLAEPKSIPGMQERGELIDTLSWVARLGLEEAERPTVLAALREAMQLAELVGRNAGNEEPLFSLRPANNRPHLKAESQVSPLAENGELFKNAPAIKGDYFKVASVLEQ